jgi:hypothetical protein
MRRKKLRQHTPRFVLDVIGKVASSNPTCILFVCFCVLSFPETCSILALLPNGLNEIFFHNIVYVYKV